MRRSIATFLLLACAACGPRVSPSTDAGGGDDGADAGGGGGGGGGGGECDETIDVVLVLDVSSSMGFVLDELEADIGQVVDAANQRAPEAHFGLIAFADNHRLDTTGDLEGGAVHTQAATLQAAFASVRSTYTAADRNPGDGPSGPTLQNPICEENALDALYAAAAEFPWRDSSARVIITATDDTFLERPDNYGDRDGDGDTTSTDFPREGDYPALRTVAETVSALTGARARVFSFTRLSPPGILERCGTGRRLAWADITDGWTTPYGAAAPIPESTDGRNYDLAQVQTGSLSLAETISEVVLESHCNPVD
ncbi:MAG TPA: vWA domain-containing protein [Kofleriaceae bacterium]|nr:vWA domain-containing protein [Kofleriaceae bacterium]